jgi:hypothetical protein
MERRPTIWKTGRVQKSLSWRCENSGRIHDFHGGGAWPFRTDQGTGGAPLRPDDRPPLGYIFFCANCSN